ncbi:hypothetical protein JF546_07960 [Nitratireductor aquimarinus]|uniref:hypothetical protein n=1 Tax=Nitratireductor aquimarinus TaxID=889300 RepID=UPI001A8E93A6|nr:hypothetical protein [Nitratireductor aquimarinus]MBN8242940.1 hypothetical protein [Nitratireductor aquimarinus]MBY6132041.1 hypothetical protein [Nitratireductor aquimarinus]MCA1301577.1 hypothetical protein [Nitratireductor aquimarinus]
MVIEENVDAFSVNQLYRGGQCCLVGLEPVLEECGCTFPVDNLQDPAFLALAAINFNGDRLAVSSDLLRQRRFNDFGFIVFEHAAILSLVNADATRNQPIHIAPGRGATNGIANMTASDLETLSERRARPEKQAANDNVRRANSKKPRHATIATQCRPLLAWRDLTAPADWTAIPVNDNNQDKPGYDAILEQRPRIGEMLRALKDVKFRTVRHVNFDGGCADHVVPASGDIEYGTGQRGKPPSVIRLGDLRFSNGRNVERGLILKDGILQRGDIRIPLGGLVSCKGYKARERYGEPKGEPGETPVPRRPTNPGAVSFADPLEQADTVESVREMVKPETAAVLDCALRAANFADIGRLQGYRGKNAERRGKQALLQACAELKTALAA